MFPNDISRINVLRTVLCCTTLRVRIVKILRTLLYCTLRIYRNVPLLRTHPKSKMTPVKICSVTPDLGLQYLRYVVKLRRIWHSIFSSRRHFQLRLFHHITHFSSLLAWLPTRAIFLEWIPCFVCFLSSRRNVLAVSYPFLPS